MGIPTLVGGAPVLSVEERYERDRSEGLRTFKVFRMGISDKTSDTMMVEAHSYEINAAGALIFWYIQRGGFQHMKHALGPGQWRRVDDVTPADVQERINNNFIEGRREMERMETAMTQGTRGKH